MSFKKNGFVVKKNLLNKQMLKLLKQQFKIFEECQYIHNNLDYSIKNYPDDGMVSNSFSCYSNFAFESLLLLLQKNCEKIVNKKLFPCNSYARIMYKGAYMAKHKDRESCQYSMSICISEDSQKPYPIFIESYSGEVHEIYLNPGDALFYKGTELYHWREEYQGTEQIQAFLFYVDANGPHKERKYDGRKCLGLPRQFQRIPKYIQRIL